jgi:hypothetical protein
MKKFPSLRQCKREMRTAYCETWDRLLKEDGEMTMVLDK